MEILRETIQEFLKLDDCYGYGNSYRYGMGLSRGNGNGYGSGLGNGTGNGYGYGMGLSRGNGNGDGSGNGNGYSNTSKTKSINGMKIFHIDGVPTIIASVFGNIAKGYIVENNICLRPCYIAKGNGYFAHGETIREAREALRDKLYANLDTEQAISMFKEKFELQKKYPAMDFYNWHHYLTGSCAAGRQNFAANHDIDLNNDIFTVEEFIALTENDYGGEIIRELKKRYGL